MRGDEHKNILYIRMLGGLKMTYGGKPFLMGKSFSSKMLHLLLILVCSREEGISREDLMERLYMDCNLEQASNSLRAVLYRLRKNLMASGLPKGDYITTKGGIYRWQADHIQVVTDAEEFQEKAIAALKETEDHKKLVLLEDACQTYSGEFLAMMTVEEWVFSANRKYQELYFTCLRELTYRLMERKQYQRLLTHCEQALIKYPYEEWQLVKLDCLIALKEYRPALRYYEQLAADCRNEFGAVPSEEMIYRYQSVKNKIRIEKSNIDDILSSLQPDGGISGATLCDYMTFIEIYRYIIWVMEREEIKAYLVLFTVVDRDGVPLEHSELLNETRRNLEAAINSAIRKSDLYTHYGKNQFLILIVDTDKKGCENVCVRIKSSFQSINKRKKVTIYYTYQNA